MKQKNFDNIIAIDPDVTKSGVAFLKPKTRHLETASLSFTELIDYLKFALDKQKDESLIVIIEASWLIKGNWHLSSWDRKQRAASKGYDDGVVAGEYSFLVVPEDPKAIGVQIDSASVTSADTFDTSEGWLTNYKVNIQKPASGKTLKKAVYTAKPKLD